MKLKRSLIISWILEYLSGSTNKTSKFLTTLRRLFTALICDTDNLMGDRLENDCFSPFVRTLPNATVLVSVATVA